MKTFLTGATGFIGASVAQRLSRAGHPLRCLVRKTSQVRELQRLGATLVRGDVTDRNSLREGMEGCDWVINLANLYSFWEPDRTIYTAVNVEGTRNVLGCALETNISKVVHVSTAAVYGKPAECPFTEASQVGPTRFSEYARTKYTSDLIAWELYQKRGLPLVMVFPGAVVGPGDTKATAQYVRDVIKGQLSATVYNDSVLTFVHVKDVAEVIVKAAEKEDNIGEKYLVGKEQLSVRECNEMIRELSGVPLPKVRLPGAVVVILSWLLTGVADVTKKAPLWGMSKDQMRTMRHGLRFDGSKAERELGITYTPIRFAFEEMVTRIKGEL